MSERDADVGVAEALLNNLRMHPGLQREGCPPVPQVMESDRRQAKAAHSFTESTGEPLRVQHRAVDVAEHEIAIRPPCTHQQPLSVLLFAVFPKRGNRAESRVIVRRPLAVLGVPSIAVC